MLLTGALALLTLSVSAPSPAAARAPVAEAAMVSVTQIAPGGDHTCALLSSGSVRCWGHNTHGEAGNGTVSANVALPVTVATVAGPLTGVTQVVSGANHSCALLASRQVRCWGENTDGQLGDGTVTTPRNRPVVVSNPAGTGALGAVTQLDAGTNHTCARLTSGEARCWGADPDGRLGDGTTTPQRTRPVAVRAITGAGNLTGVTQISAGETHTCARVSSGRVRCWGGNSDGRLGDGTTTPRVRPVAVVGPSGSGQLRGVAEVVAATFHSCARLTAGTVRCWGEDDFGELGDGSVADSAVPVAVQNPGGDDDLRNVTQIVGQGAHTCVRTTTGRARCWGLNAARQTGDGTTTNRNLPVEVRNPPGTGSLTHVRLVAGGYLHSCALLTNTQVRCWGSNGDAELGDGSTAGRTLPVVVRIN
jgi:alpha-tubulin suppressor-like RCC1 family protein